MKKFLFGILLGVALLCGGDTYATITGTGAPVPIASPVVNGSSTLGALNATMSIPAVSPTASYSTAVITVSGTWSGTISFTYQGGALAAYPMVNGVPGTTSVTSITGNGSWAFSIASLGPVTITMTSYTSGTATVTWTASSFTITPLVETSGSVTQATNPWITQDKSDGTVAAGTVASNSALMGCIFNTTLPTVGNGQGVAVQCDALGRQLATIGTVTTSGNLALTNNASSTSYLNQAGGTLVSPQGTNAATYVEDIHNQVCPTGDCLTLFGSATKTVYVIRVGCSAVQTSLGNSWAYSLIKRSTSDTGGTSAATTAVPYDSNDSAATATGLLSYTVAPTPGTSVGPIRSFTGTGSQATATYGSDGGEIGWDFGRDGREIILRGTSQGVAINFSSVSSTGQDCYIEWREQ